MCSTIVDGNFCSYTCSHGLADDLELCLGYKQTEVIDHGILSTIIHNPFFRTTAPNQLRWFPLHSALRFRIKRFLVIG